MKRIIKESYSFLILTEIGKKLCFPMNLIGTVQNIGESEMKLWVVFPEETVM